MILYTLIMAGVFVWLVSFKLVHLKKHEHWEPDKSCSTCKEIIGMAFTVSLIIALSSCGLIIIIENSK